MLSVYVVEDSPVVQECLLGLIDDVDGCALLGVADNEPQALREIAALRPDLVILDLYINAGTGFAVLKRTKSDFPETRVLVLTNLNGAAMVEKCREYGADGFFDKTSELDRLEDALVAAVNGDGQGRGRGSGPPGGEG